MPELRPRFTLPTRQSLRLRPQRAATPAPEVSMEARPEDVVSPVEQSMVDAAIYRDGRRIESPATVAEAAKHLAEQEDTIAWIGLLRPTEAQLVPVAPELGLEDAIVAHQRPKLERYGDTLFVVLRAATYLDAQEEVEFGEIHVFVGRRFVITVRHSRTPNLGALRHRMEEDPDLLARGTEAILYAILDSVVDGYA